MPYSFCVDLALAEGFSLDWLILGQERDGMDVYAAILAFTHIQPMSKSSSIDIERISTADMAEHFATAYDRFVTLLNNETEKGRSREEVATFVGEVMTVLLQVPGSVEDERRPVDPRQVFGSPRGLQMPPEIKPGPEHIPPKQVKALLELIREAADHDLASGRSESGALVNSWKPLNRRYGVPSYRLIPREFGDDAIAWMTQRVARLRSRLNGADYVPWRTELYVAIYTQARQLGYSKDKLFAIAFDHLGKRITTLKQLDDQDLKKLHGLIVSTEH